MPWITNALGIELTLATAYERGLTIDTWWRDDITLTEFWDTMGYPHAPHVVALPAGDLYAYVTRYQEALTLIGLAPLFAENRTEYTLLELQASVGNKRLHDSFITQYTKRREENLPVAPVAAGDRVGVCVHATQEGQLGIAVTVDDAGRCITVQLEPNGPPVPAESVGRRWFSWNERNEAFDFYWAEGRTRFSHYMAMLGAIAGKQKRLTQRPQRKEARAVPKPKSAAEERGERLTVAERAVLTDVIQQSLGRKALCIELGMGEQEADRKAQDWREAEMAKRGISV